VGDTGWQRTVPAFSCNLIRHSDNYADWAMTRLDRAQCLIYTGDITSGLEYASETITTIAPAQRRGIITLRGRGIVETLPEGEKRLPAARSFQELLQRLKVWGLCLLDHTRRACVLCVAGGSTPEL